MSAPEIINPPGGGGGGGGTVTGTGTPGKLAKFATASSIGDSLLSESGTTITSAATAETFGSAQTWTVGAPNSQALVVLSNAGAERTLVLDTISRAVGVGVPTTPSTLLHVSDGVTTFAGTTGAGVRLDRATEALFSSSDGTRSLRAGLTGGTAVVGTSTAHDLLLQRGSVTAITLGASGAVAFAGNLTSSAAQTWTLATSTTALNIQSGLLNLDTTNSRVGVGTASPAATLEAYATATGEVRASSDVFSVVSSCTFNNTLAAFAPSIKLSRARGTRAVPVAVNALDTIGTIGWNAQGTTDHQIANIQCTAPANAGADAISSQLTFATSLTSDVLPVVRLTIDPAGVASFAGPVRATGTNAAAPAFTGSDTDTGMYFPAANQVRLATNGSVAIAIDSSQRVGVNQPTPLAPLHAAGTSITAASTTTASAGILRVEGSATNALFCGSFSDSPFGMCLQTNSASYPLALQPAGGNVGIGTTNPTSLLTVNGNLAFNSGYGSAAVAYGCRAWVNFNGTTTITIRASGGISSITRTSAGVYVTNFSVAMPDANYSAIATKQNVASNVSCGFYDLIASRTTSAATWNCIENAAVVDSANINIAFFR